MLKFSKLGLLDCKILAYDNYTFEVYLRRIVLKVRFFSREL